MILLAFCGHSTNDWNVTENLHGSRRVPKGASPGWWMLGSSPWGSCYCHGQLTRKTLRSGTQCVRKDIAAVQVE